jgi:hypothetical protein
MKKIIFSILTLSLIVGSISCQEKVDVAKETEAIKDLIEEATSAFVDRDIDRITATHVTDETLIRLGASKNSYNYNIGWEERLAFTKTYFAENPDPVYVKFENKNYKIKVFPQSALAVYEENWYDNDGEFVYMSINTRFIEKVDGKWKIVYLSVIDTTSYEEEVEEEESETEE